MKVSLNKIDDLNLGLTIEVEAADYAETERKKLAERRRTADFKGFRKGNVPASLIKKVYGEQCLVEAVNIAVSDALENYIREEKLNILGEPLSSEKQPELVWEDGNSFTFVFDLALSPEVSVEFGKSDSVPSYEVTVDKEDLDSAVGNAKKYYEEQKQEKSEEDIEKEAAAQLELRYKNEAAWRLDNDIRNYAIEKAALPLPEAFLKRWLLEANKEKLTAEDVEKEFDGFAKDFRWQLIRGSLMQKYGFKVEDADLRAAAEGYLKAQYAMYGIADVPEDFIQQSVVNMLQDRQQLQRIYEQVEDTKVLGRLKEEITVKTEKIGSKAFRELK